MWNLIILLGAVIFAAGDPVKVSRPRLDGRIVGGEDASITEFPHQISLRVPVSLTKWQHICGGSIIANDTVLTAAHCVSELNKDLLQIRAGGSKLSLQNVLHNITRIRIHRKYDPKTVDYDVAVLTVSPPFNYTDEVKNITLQSETVEPGTPSTVTGWGFKVELANKTSEILQKVNVSVVSTSDCKKAYGNSAITSRMICAGVTQGGKDACQGDSGGPLIANGRQIGIVSWGEGCGRRGYPGVYTNVSELRDWIINGTRASSVNSVLIFISFAFYVMYQLF